MLTYILLGLTIGAIYALIAVGFSLIFETVKLLHFAQGELLMLGGFVALTLIGLFGLNPIIVGLGTMVAVGFFAAFLQLVVYQSVPPRLIAVRIMATLGVAIFLRNAASLTWGAKAKTIPEAFFPGGPIAIAGLTIRPGYYWTLIVSIAVMALLLWFLPGSCLEWTLGGGKKKTLDDLATIIFSSGSTGEPKGVMLTHCNIASNIEQMGQTFMFDRNDSLLGVLPFFHSFGFTVTLWLPAVLGVGAVYHPSPLDLSVVSELVRDFRLTFLMATPTFLQAYLRRCSPEDFGSLEFVLVGAEKLPERLALAFEDRFGVRPLEGYGTTECSPVITVNTRDFRAPGFRQVGGKRGRIGHPLPGVSVRIVDPETREPVPVGMPGLLIVRGPNVMLGYLGKPEKTAEVLQDGWYVTGDIATEDEDGFLSITDRLSRFSKIGGEMVPHIKIEERLHEIAGATEQRFVVTAVPDGKKGERLVVLHLLAEEELRVVIERLPEAGLPNLWTPRPNQFFAVEEFPHLGTGKLDLRRIRELALEFSAAGKEA